MIRDVMDLEVYRQSLVLLKDLYQLLRSLPLSERDTESQLKRAAKSICANIAEGFAKRSSEKEFKRYLKIALGSSDEVVTHLRTVDITVPRLQSQTAILSGQYITLSKQLNKLHSVWHSDKF